jgi:TPR repeat protein
MAALSGLCDGGFFHACTRLAYVYVAKTGAADRRRARELLTRACEGGERDACAMARQVE